MQYVLCTTAAAWGSDFVAGQPNLTESESLTRGTHAYGPHARQGSQVAWAVESVRVRMFWGPLNNISD